MSGRLLSPRALITVLLLLLLAALPAIAQAVGDRPLEQAVAYALETSAPM